MNDPFRPSVPTPALAHVDALAAGERLGEFELVGLLGVGGFGMVYQAFDHSLHRPVAIKEYMPTALAGRAEGQAVVIRSASDESAFRAGLASFVGEARLLAQFDHPSLVKVFRFWEANHTAYMVMPLYTGMTLKQARAHMRTPPPEAWLRTVLWSVLGALRVLHDGSTLHRDISPDNIFLQDNGPPVLLDLGAARYAINDRDHKHTAVLKVNYAPIEQFAQGEEDLRPGPWSDLYSLAAVVYGCICNDAPLPATLRSIRDRMVPFKRVAKTVQQQWGVSYSDAFVATISQALALRPEDRPQNIDAFLAGMQMTESPADSVAFDFRAALHGAWIAPSPLDAMAEKGVAGAAIAAPLSVPDADDAGDAHARTIVLPVEHQRARDERAAREAADTVVMEDERLPSALPPPSVAGVRSPARRRVLWAAAGGGALAVVMALLEWGVLSPGTSGALVVQDDIITELAEPPRPLASVSTEAGGGAVAGSGLQGESIAAGERSPQGTAPLARASSGPALRELPAATLADSVRVPASGTTDATVPAVPATPAAPQPPSRSRPVPAALPSPQETCAGESFLARPLCVHRECQKPALAALPICVETRRRYEAERQRLMQSPN